MNLEKMSKLAKFGVEPDATRYVFNKNDYEDYTVATVELAKAIIENKSMVHIDLSFN